MAAETATFGINDEGVHLDVPQAVVDHILSHVDDHAVDRLLGVKRRDRAFDFRDIDGGHSLQLEPARLARMSDVTRGDALKDMVRIIELMQDRSPLEQTDPRLDLLMGIERGSVMRHFGMNASAQWPDDISDQDLQARVTQVMVKTANAMRYQHPQRITVNVGATIDRARGVQIDTAKSQVPTGRLTTDTVHPYRPDAKAIRIEGYSLENRQQQILALHGLVAFIEGAN